MRDRELGWSVELMLNWHAFTSRALTAPVGVGSLRFKVRTVTVNYIGRKPPSSTHKGPLATSPKKWRAFLIGSKDAIHIGYRQWRNRH